MKNILVFGGSGFLGRHLTPSLHKLGYNVINPTSNEVDLLNITKADPFEGTRFDEVWHLAVWTQAGTFCDICRGDQWLVNQQINTSVLRYWEAFQTQAKLITFGTSVSYSNEENLEEDAYMTGEPKDKFLAYAMCKRMLLTGLQCLNRQYGMDYLYLVPSTLYGPSYHTDGRQLHFIYDLIRKILNAKRTGETVVLWGDGNQSRELVYVDDFVRIAIDLNKKTSNEIVNIGAGHDISIREFAERICAIVAYDFSKIQYDTSKYVGAKSKCLSIDKLNDILPTRSLTPLKDGLEKTINWVSENLEQLNRIE